METPLTEEAAPGAEAVLENPARRWVAAVVCMECRGRHSPHFQCEKGSLEITEGRRFMGHRPCRCSDPGEEIRSG